MPFADSVAIFLTLLMAAGGAYATAQLRLKAVRAKRLKR
jgi:hypothetical protein